MYFFCVKLTTKRSSSQPSAPGESGKRSRLFSLQQALDLVYDSDEDEQDLVDIYPESDLESVDSDVNSESSNEDEGLDVDLDLDISSPAPRPSTAQVYARPICASNVGPPVGLTTTLKWNIGAK